MTNLQEITQKVLIAQAKQRCLREWEDVNGPPCHPEDEDWNGCIHCIDRKGLAAAITEIVNELGYNNFNLDGDHGINVVNCKDLIAIATELKQ